MLSSCKVHILTEGTLHFIGTSPEAALIKSVFDLYLELGSVRKLKEEVDRRGYVTKRRIREEHPIGGKPLNRGHLYWILKNPIYVGEVSHKGKCYPGQHEAIINRDTWVAAQNKLDGNAANRHLTTNNRQRNFLTGKMYDDTGDPLCPTYTIKAGRKHRYYVSKKLLHGGVSQ